jgi:transcriptional regulator with XRE-family HTH domain
MDDVKLNRLIRTARKKRELTLTELAKRVGVSLSYLSRVESGHHKVLSEKLLSRLATELALTEDDVFASAGRIPNDVHRYLIDNPKAIAKVRTMMGDAA